jgi:hypothetical protein
MAIKIKKNSDFTYLGVADLIDEKEKNRADDIYKTSEIEFNRLNQSLKNKKDISSLEFWHSIGRLANKIILDFGISDFEKKYFWLMLYDFSGKKAPDRALKFHIQNDFHIASMIAKYNLKDLRKTGPWATWHEIIGSTKTMKDERVGRWAVEYIINNQIKTRNNVRPILKFARNRLKNLNTLVLSDSELFSKLDEIKK